MFHFMGSSGDNEMQGKDRKDIAEGNSMMNQKILPKAGEPTEVELVDASSIKSKKKPAHADRECQYFYGGIGIYVNDNDVVTEVIAGYPAHVLGIKQGNLVLTSRTDCRGEVGTSVTIVWENEDGRHVDETIRDKICLDAPP